MNDQQDSKLLADLVKLMIKHGPDTFESLSKKLSSPEFTQNLSNTLLNLSKNRGNIQLNKKNVQSKTSMNIPRALIVFKDKDSEKYELLNRFYNKLVMNELLPSLGEIREFVSDLGLKEIKEKSRQKAVNSLINLLAELPNEQIKLKISSLRKYSGGDRSLQGWSDIILNKG